MENQKNPVDEVNDIARRAWNTSCPNNDLAEYFQNLINMLVLATTNCANCPYHPNAATKWELLLKGTRSLLSYINNIPEEGC